MNSFLNVSLLFTKCPCQSLMRHINFLGFGGGLGLHKLFSRYLPTIQVFGGGLGLNELYSECLPTIP